MSARLSMLQNTARRLRQAFARRPTVRLLFALLAWALACVAALGVAVLLLGGMAGLVMEPALYAAWVGVVVVLATPSVGLGKAFALVAALGLLAWLASDPAGVGTVLLVLFALAAVGGRRPASVKGSKG